VDDRLLPLLQPVLKVSSVRAHLVLQLRVQLLHQLEGQLAQDELGRDGVHQQLIQPEADLVERFWALLAHDLASNLRDVQLPVRVLDDLVRLEGIPGKAGRRGA
jgi:hypothetical protein